VQEAGDELSSKDSPLGNIGSLFGADVARMASGTLQSVCDSMFGSGIVDFRSNALLSIGRGGSEKVLTRVEYRGGGGHIAVLPLDPGAFGVAVFDFKRHDRLLDPFAARAPNVGDSALLRAARWVPPQQRLAWCSLHAARVHYRFALRLQRRPRCTTT
jgi:hypothetical protein